jgi:hypothetical protein
MLYRHKKTGETREFVQGMHIGSDWSRVVTMQHGAGTLSITEVDPKSIDTIKSRRAAATRAKNKAKSKTAAKKTTKKEGKK